MGTRLLGIDIGTTGTRAALFEEDGTLVAEASAARSFDAPEPGWAEANALGFWLSTKTALAELRAKEDLATVACVAVCGQAPTIVLVGDDGAPLAPAILWLDTRADAEARELGVHAYYLGPKLLWLSR